jgi:hypothetical protein|tara:strand:+ start:1206 stop:1457 length:252 start_codon:yes stop_codon:yes gene_type:complete
MIGKTNKQSIIDEILMVNARQIASSNPFQLLAEQSTGNGEQRYTESQIRDMVGAPSLEENEMCICGDEIVNCAHSYDHMTHGV